MAVKIKFDSTYNVQSPTIVLATRSGKKLGVLPAYDIVFKEKLNSFSELNFRVNKRYNGKNIDIWNSIKDFKLIWCREWDIWFEIYVELDESDMSIKNISAKSLGEAELSQIMLYNIEINTEKDILRDDYEPTVLFDSSNSKASLLDRIMEKAPHYKIKHVDSSISHIQRTFSFDNTALYDAFQSISEEINCIFIIESGSDKDGKIDRAISVYDLESYCLECGERGEFITHCTKCGSPNISFGYGDDTTIFISADNLADSITYETDVDSVKNCFKLEAGDDLMTSTLINCNPNGSGYIWFISDETKEDMSEELVQKLNQYDILYDYYQNDYECVLDSGVLSKYNSLVDKYFSFSSNLKKITNPIIGYPNLMNAYYDTIDFLLLLTSGLMPSPTLLDTTASEQAAKLTTNNLSPVAVSDISSCSVSTASSAVLSVAKVLVDPRYQVKVKDGALDNTTWTGSFIITNYSDEEDSAISSTISVVINDDYEEYVKQKIDKALSNSSGDVNDIVSIFKLSLEDFNLEIKKYCLHSLNSFHDACQSCVDILIEQGIANDETWEDNSDNLYEKLYVPFYNKLASINDEIMLREQEIATISGSYDSDGRLKENGVQPTIESKRQTIQSELDFEKHLGIYWNEFVSYRREDTYSNQNYISDGLNNAELFRNALEFVNIAKKDIYKSATLQHKISATLKNLLVIKEFSPIVEHFKTGNWIRSKIDGSVYRLRLIEYEIDFNNLEYIPVVFSDVIKTKDGINDVASILSEASSMATSYGSVSRQAGQGEDSNKRLNSWVNDGLALTKMKIVDSADNQNVTWDSHGLLCKEYLPITDEYDDKQLKIINRGLYLTDDNWKTSKAGIGDFSYYDPEDGKMKDGYGVIADKLVGNLVLSKKVGVYNPDNSVTIDENGIVVTSDGTVEDSNKIAFTIQQKTLDADGNETLSPIFCLDSNGNLILNGSIKVSSSSNENISSLNDICDKGAMDATINEIVDRKVEAVNKTIQEKNDEVLSLANEQLNNYKAEVGQYMSYDESGLTLGAKNSLFKTVLDNQMLGFLQDNTRVTYISNSQLYILDAIIKNSLILGNFFISPREDKGMSIIWQE